MTSFTQMAAVLGTLNVPAWSEGQAKPKGLNRTETIRQLLKTANRPVTAAEIAFDMGDEFPNFGSHLVWLLLKYDISKGRVTLDKDRGTYRWNHEYDTATAEAIRQAEKLLKRHGYKVRAPA